jgi:hypothetical protein
MIITKELWVPHTECPVAHCITRWMFVLAPKRAVACWDWSQWRPLDRVRIGPEKGSRLPVLGSNEDHWIDTAPAARLVWMLSESTGARKLIASVVGRIVLVADAWGLSESAGASSQSGRQPLCEDSRGPLVLVIFSYSLYEWYSSVHWMLGTRDTRLLYFAS